MRSAFSPPNDVDPPIAPQLSVLLRGDLLYEIAEKFTGMKAPARSAAHRGTEAKRLASALGDPEVMGRVLEALSPDALVAVCLIVDFGTMPPAPVLEACLAAALGGEERMRRTIAEAAEVRLNLAAGERAMLGLPGPMCEALAPLLPAVEGAPVEGLTPSRDVRSLRFDDTLLLSFIAASGPRINAGDGQIHSTDLRRMEKELARAAPRLASRPLEPAVKTARHHGLLCGETRLALDVAVATRDAEREDREWSARRILALAQSTDSAWCFRRALDLLDEAGAAFVRATTLERLARQSCATVSDVRGEARYQTLLGALVPLLEEARDAAGALHYRLPQPRDAAAGDGKMLVVQPSFEVLAPPETPPLLLLTLGRYAELVAADVYATFRLTPESVKAAIDGGGKLDLLLGLLERHAAHGVPQNVSWTVRDWAQGRGRVSLATGTAIIVEEVAAIGAITGALSAQLITWSQPAPNVIMVHSFEIARARSVLKGLQLTPTEDTPSHLSKALQGFASESVAGTRTLPDPDQPEAARRRALTRKLAGRIASRPSSSPARGSSASAGSAHTASARSAVSRQARGPAPPLDDDGTERALAVLLEAAARDEDIVELTVRVSPLGETELVRLLVERVRRRGNAAFVEGIGLDDEENLSIPMAAIVSACSLSSPRVAPRRAAPEIGRNQPCPCASGLKYKRCCMGKNSMPPSG